MTVVMVVLIHTRQHANDCSLRGQKPLLPVHQLPPHERKTNTPYQIRIQVHHVTEAQETTNYLPTSADGSSGGWF
jgi:hypothetical protein